MELYNESVKLDYFSVFNVSLDILYSLYFHMNFIISLSIFFQETLWDFDLDDIVDHFRQNDITTLSLSKHEHGVFLHLFSSYFKKFYSFQCSSLISFVLFMCKFSIFLHFM